MPSNKKIPENFLRDFFIHFKVKGYPFEVKLPIDFPIQGVILSDQVKSLDWKARHAEFIGSLPLPTLDEVIAKLKPLFGIREEA